MTVTDTTPEKPKGLIDTKALAGFFDPDKLADTAKSFVQDKVNSSISGVTDIADKAASVLTPDGKEQLEKAKDSLLSMISGFFEKFSFGGIFAKIAELFKGFTGGTQTTPSADVAPDQKTDPVIEQQKDDTHKLGQLPSQNTPNLKDKTTVAAK